MSNFLQYLCRRVGFKGQVPAMVSWQQWVCEKWIELFIVAQRAHGDKIHIHFSYLFIFHTTSSITYHAVCSKVVAYTTISIISNMSLSIMYSVV